jgi:pimeloyl-ACP methyl ester carboxylesterase
MGHQSLNMPTQISSLAGPVRGFDQLKQLDRSSAQVTLKQLATQINGKSGTLKLMHSGAQDTGMVFERKSWWQFFVKPSSRNEKMREALRTLYDRAGMSDIAKQQLEQYLGLKNKRLGGSELANLFNKHLRNQISDALVQRILPKEAASIRGIIRDNLLGTHAQRHAPTDDPLGFLESTKNYMQQMPEFNANYQISEGPQDPHQLVGISRSANANNPQFDLNAPIVVFFSGSHSSSDAHAYPAAKISGTDARTPQNFLAVDYRGFGQSSDINPTPHTITQDAMKVYEHVKSLGFKPEQIILRGYSMGAAAAAKVHAHAELKGERLGGVVYDRPMSSAPKAAYDSAVNGCKNIDKWVAQKTVGEFGADRYLDKIPRKKLKMLAPVLVLADNEKELGPSARAMAAKQKLKFVDTNGEHENHTLANFCVENFLTNI